MKNVYTNLISTKNHSGQSELYFSPQKGSTVQMRTSKKYVPYPKEKQRRACLSFEQDTGENKIEIACTEASKTEAISKREETKTSLLFRD